MRQQSGWDTETKLLYSIVKKLDRLIAVASKRQGGSTTTTTSTTSAPTTSTTSSTSTSTSTTSTSTTQTPTTSTTSSTTSSTTTQAPTTSTTSSTTSTSTSTSTTSTSTSTSTTTTVAPENLLACSNEFDSYGIWQQYSAVIGVNDNGDGSWTLTSPSSNAGIFQMISGVTGDQSFCFSAEFLSVPSGFRIGIENNAGAAIQYKDITSDVPGGSFVRVSVTGVLPSGQTQIAVVFEFTGSSGSVTMKNAQLNLGTSTKPYIETAC